MQQPVVSIKQGEIKRGDQLILQDVNLIMYPGDFNYLIGKTGSGKSSFIKALYGEWPWSGGEVTVAGMDLRKLKPAKLHHLRRKLGIVFQEFFLLRDKTVYENLDFVLSATGWRKKQDRNARISTVLEDTGLSAFGFRYPSELSGGEQQRLAIARALLNEPVLLLADEPAGNLDPETSNEITQLIRHLARDNKAAVLFATHDYRIIERYPSPILKVDHNTLKPLEKLPPIH